MIDLTPTEIVVLKKCALDLETPGWGGTLASGAEEDAVRRLCRRDLVDWKRVDSGRAVRYGYGISDAGRVVLAEVRAEERSGLRETA